MYFFFLTYLAYGVYVVSLQYVMSSTSLSEPYFYKQTVNGVLRHAFRHRIDFLHLVIYYRAHSYRHGRGNGAFPLLTSSRHTTVANRMRLFSIVESPADRSFIRFGDTNGAFTLATCGCLSAFWLQSHNGEQDITLFPRVALGPVFLPGNESHEKDEPISGDSEVTRRNYLHPVNIANTTPAVAEVQRPLPRKLFLNYSASEKLPPGSVLRCDHR